MSQKYFKTEAKLLPFNPLDRDAEVEVRIWVCQGGSCHANGGPLHMTKQEYILFMHAFKAKHELKEDAS